MGDFLSYFLLSDLAHFFTASDINVDKITESGSEAWQEFDFEGLRKELSEQINAIIRQVDFKQEEGRTNNNQ